MARRKRRGIANPSTYFHILGFDLAGRQVMHDMQSDQYAAGQAARHMLRYGDPSLVRAAVHVGALDEYDPQPAAEHFVEVPTPVSAEQAAGADGLVSYSFWIDPYGDVYPVAAFGRVAVEERLLKYALVPRAENAPFWQSHAIAARWLQVSERGDGHIMFDYATAPTQRQLDAVFDLAQAHLARAKSPGASRARELFARDAMEWLNEPTVTRRNPGEPCQRACAVCMVCGGVIHEGAVGPRGEVSHGICKSCFPAWAERMQLTPEDVAEILAEEAAEEQKNPAVDLAAAGKRLKRWAQSAEGYEWLDSFTRLATSWLAGGCVPMALALQQLWPEGQLVGVVSAGVMHHVALLVDGRILDGGGVRQPRSVLRWWAVEVTNPKLVPATRSDATRILRENPDLIEKLDSFVPALAEHLLHVLS